MKNTNRENEITPLIWIGLVSGLISMVAPFLGDSDNLTVGIIVGIIILVTWGWVFLRTRFQKGDEELNRYINKVWVEEKSDSGFRSKFSFFTIKYDKTEGKYKLMGKSTQNGFDDNVSIRVTWENESQILKDTKDDFYYIYSLTDDKRTIDRNNPKEEVIPKVGLTYLSFNQGKGYYIDKDKHLGFKLEELDLLEGEDAYRWILSDKKVICESKKRFKKVIEKERNEARHIVFTGGSISGKSKALEIFNSIKLQMGTNSKTAFQPLVQTLPEIARKVIEKLQELTGLEGQCWEDWKDDNFQVYQHLIAAIQLAREKDAKKNDGDCLLDRSALDGYAYCIKREKSTDWFSELKEKLIDRNYFKIVFVFETVPEEEFNKILAEDPVRSSKYHDSVSISEELEKLYYNLGYEIVKVPYYTDEEGGIYTRCQDVLKELDWKPKEGINRAIENLKQEHIKRVLLKK